ncbi:uncharacterized protein [Aegilops tauschii subsp. strangulata]|uniref:uncharacterized protein isoform X2 n=1 Tax=Aegilops tauschii subsp. strangulata TaxID=200361 RepID=UPI000989C4DD|nr:uncharacterized protein LOC109773165 isoform X2 [Aegilops tauschii subsp. strangulata]
MESSAGGGDPRPSPSGGASPPPPPPPPPPPSGWLAGLVSGAGRLLASVLGPSPSSSPRGSGPAASGGSASSSPTSFCHPREGLHGGAGADFDDSVRVPSKNNQLNQSEETDLKDYTQGSLAIVSEIEPKDAIMQLLMQETYSRSECSTLIKIIQERVVDPDSGGIADGEIALPISWKADNQPTLGYSSFSPNVSLPSTSNFRIHGHGFDNSAAADTVPILTPASRSLFNDKADNIQPAFKRRYSVVRDIPEDLRRVRTKADGNPIHITKFKQVDVVRNRPGEGNKLLSDVPLLGANNLAHSNIVSKVERANEKLDVPSKPPAVPNKDLKNGFPLKLEPLDGLIPFEQKMMDLSHQKHKDAAYDDSGSVSKLMFMGDIEATPSLQLQNGSKNRRRKQSNSPRTTPRATDSPAMGTRRRLGDATVKGEIKLEQTTPIAMDKQDPDYVPERRPAGRPKKAK